jgi:hypothetical protein
MTEALALTPVQHWVAYLYLNGYRGFKPLPPDRVACLMPLAFTTAIIVCRALDYDTYEDRWCYHTADAAQAALEAWDGTGEPTGWHRHPATGRRVDAEGNAYVAI